MFPFVATTQDLTVRVQPVYLDGESDVIARRFVFGYLIRIDNGGTETVQLLRRKWIIRDQEGRIETIEGAGVVGKQPLIKPEGYHTYTSFCVLKTFEGSMQGSYLMQRPSGEGFEIAIPRFVLRAAAN